MQVQPITNNTFTSKNTFLQKAKLALSVEDKSYYKSLHYEAKSRMHYLKYQKADSELANFDEINLKNAFNFVKVVLKLASEKLKSVLNQTDAFHMYPTRFYMADNKKANPHRYYKTNKL